MKQQIQFEREVPPRDERQRNLGARWSVVRQRGRISYIIRRGILVYGVLFATFMTALRLTGFLRAPQPFSARVALFMFLFYAVFFGLWMGLWLWHSNEKRFKAL